MNIEYVGGPLDGAPVEESFIRSYSVRIPIRPRLPAPTLSSYTWPPEPQFFERHYYERERAHGYQTLYYLVYKGRIAT